MSELKRIEESQPSGEATSSSTSSTLNSTLNNSITSGSGQSLTSKGTVVAQRPWFKRLFPHLPDYLGPYPVGVHDIETPPNAAKNTKGVLIRLYYPTTSAATKAHSRAKWLPKGTLYSVGYGNFSKLPTILSLAFIYPLLAGVNTPGYLNAPLRHAGKGDDSPPPLPTRLPCMIFSHGLGGMRTTYSTFCGNIASQGFIVAAIEHRDGSAAVASRNAYKEKIRYRHPNNDHRKPGETVDEYLLRFRRSQVEVKAGEVKEVMQLLMDLEAGTAIENLMATKRTKGFEGQFTGRFDFDNWVMSGHSFGGATCLTALQDPSNPFKCGIALDPWMHAVSDAHHVGKPFISVQSENFQWKTNLDPLADLFSHTESSSKSRFGVLRGTAHQDVSDFPALFPGLMKRIKLSGAGDPIRALQLYHEWHLQFLKEELETEVPFGDYPGFEKESKDRPKEIVEGKEAFDMLYGSIRHDWGR
ncbi:1-alkyl-2-acetylglycerophosphocholine esterase [Spizellomyces sp. 'palustris']|nr:1-alkyl-2-acetylglycerophosphocholine esterase [Spizellomyces sp. 'palustris']